MHGSTHLEAPTTWIPSPVHSRIMRANKRSDTKPEVALRSALHRTGFRFRKDVPLRLGGSVIRPDIVFSRKKVAVFVDGCFWHGCPDHYRSPRQNLEFWSRKLQVNVERDARQTALLLENDWTVIRIWEHEPVQDAVAQITAILHGDSGKSDMSSVRRIAPQGH